MERHQPPAARSFFDTWFKEINGDNGLPRVHDRKLSIMALCALLDLDASAIPASLQEGWAGIVGAIVHVFQGLPAALESEIVSAFCFNFAANCAFKSERLSRIHSRRTKKKKTTTAKAWKPWRWRMMMVCLFEMCISKSSNDRDTR